MSLEYIDFLVGWFNSTKEVTIAKRKDTSTKHLYRIGTQNDKTTLMRQMGLTFKISTVDFNYFLCGRDFE